MPRKKRAPAAPRPLTQEEALDMLGRIADRDAAGNFVIDDAEAMRLW
jgi:hypothetical protein